MDAKVGKILPGSIYYLEEDFFKNLLRKIITNISEQGFKKIIIVSAHSGTAQHKVLDEIGKEKFKSISVITLPGRNFVGSIDHAGIIETSLMLYLAPELVDMTKLHKPYEGIMGVDPVSATAEIGKKQFDAIVNQIINLVKNND